MLDFEQTLSFFYSTLETILVNHPSNLNSLTLSLCLHCVKIKFFRAPVYYILELEKKSKKLCCVLGNVNFYHFDFGTQIV